MSEEKPRMESFASAGNMQRSLSLSAPPMSMLMSSQMSSPSPAPPPMVSPMVSPIARSRVFVPPRLTESCRFAVASEREEMGRSPRTLRDSSLLDTLAVVTEKLTSAFGALDTFIKENSREMESEGYVKQRRHAQYDADALKIAHDVLDAAYMEVRDGAALLEIPAELIAKNADELRCLREFRKRFY